MSVILAQVIIDQSTNQIITGKYLFDRSGNNSGSFTAPSGSAFPSETVANELFWRHDENKLYIRNGTNTAWVDVGATGGAPTDAQYLVLSANGSLSAERVFTAGVGMRATDAGAGAAYTFGINDGVVATISGSRFTGPVRAAGGLSGSLQQLDNGTSYLVAGNNITITSGTNGQVIVASTGGGTSRETIRFQMLGLLSASTIQIDGAWFSPASGTIEAVKMYRHLSGTSGNTVLDVNKNGTTIFTTQGNRPSVANSSGNDVLTTATTPDVTSLDPDDRITVDIDSVEGGWPMDVTLQLNVTYP